MHLLNPLDMRPPLEYHRAPMDRSLRLRLHDYYLVEAINAFACTIFGSCLFFWTRARYGFTDAENLLLATVQGVLYALAPAAGGRLGDRFGYDRLLLVGTLGMLASALLAVLLHVRWMPYVALALFTGSMSLTWPVLEASVVVLPGRLATPDRLGIYNVVWAGTAALAFFAAGALFRLHPDAIVWGTVAAHLAMLGWILPRRATVQAPAAARASHRGDHVPREEKTRFLRLAWAGNCMGYVMQAGLMATAPAIGERLDLPPSATIWLICTFFAARGVAFVALWRRTAWHYRMRWMAGAFVVGPASLALVFFAPFASIVFVGLLGFGAAIGMAYYASIYYSLDYGDAKASHGGLHESIIGLGGLLGPLTGVAGAALLGSTAGAQGAIVALAALIAASSLGLVRRRPT